jgi:hypothetical protein
MAASGQSLQIVAHRKSLHFRCSPKATQSQALASGAKGHAHQIAAALNARGITTPRVVRAISTRALTLVGCPILCRFSDVAPGKVQGGRMM